MRASIHELKSFYNGRMGRFVRRILQDRIRRLWPDLGGLQLMGCGYAVPYLRIFREEAARVTAMMPAGQGAVYWPHDDRNCVFLAEAFHLPIESNTVDRILMVHSLEFTRHPVEYLREIARVLKSNGRALIIVPNRSGLWAHSEWSPFGHGTPYSLSQLLHNLGESNLTCERTEEALFIPPLKFTPLLKSAGFLERIGPYCLPVAAGVHMVEAGKQVYARITPDSGLKVPARIAPLPVSEPAGRKSF